MNKLHKTYRDIHWKKPALITVILTLLAYAVMAAVVAFLLKWFAIVFILLQSN